MYQLWKEAFDEDDREYIRFFLEEGLPLGKMLNIGPVEHPQAALTLFPITLQQASGEQISGYYLYALGTLKAERGKGYGSRLVQAAADYAAKNDRKFILLQPTNSSLFEYYARLGYNSPVYRAQISFSRQELQQSISAPNSATASLLSAISAPTNPAQNQINYFSWPEECLAYIRKECLYRGGAMIRGAYCYPKENLIEIKQFYATKEDIYLLIIEILSHYPKASGFLFYGKSIIEVNEPITQSVFALAHFINSDDAQRFKTMQSYFALGLD